MSRSVCLAVLLLAGVNATVASAQSPVVGWGDSTYEQSAPPLLFVNPIAAGGWNSLALKSDGTVVAWGSNNFGELNVPTDLNGATSVAAGWEHSLALKSDGTVVAWGLNDNGQATVPPALSGVTAIAAGGWHSLALRSDGTVVAWGNNIAGQLNVPTDLRGVTAIAAGEYHNLAVVNGTVVAWGSNSSGHVPTALTGVAAVAAGFDHSVALQNDGTVVAWGRNDYGQATVPADLTGVKAIASGYFHSLALKSDGTVVAWGRNDDGQATVPATLSGVTAIAAGYFHSLALKSDGTVVAWGRNGSRQLNVPAGLICGTSLIAVAAGGWHSLALRVGGSLVAWGRNDYGQATVPAGLTPVKAIAAGDYHNLAVKNDSSVVAWGDNTHGQLNVPTDLTGVAAVAAGRSHSMARKSDGTVVAWGLNDDGQATVPPGLSGVTAIAAGGYHSLALVNGTVMAWGNNGVGQASVPAGLSGVTAIAAGGWHSLALRSDGTVVAWGYDGDGQATVPPAALSGVKAIAAGRDHSLALKKDGTVVAWGYDKARQATVPTDLSRVIAISAGVAHSLALKNVPPLLINSVDPMSGPTTGGTAVTVDLSACQPGVSVAFDGIHATCRLYTLAAEVCQCWTPPHAAGSVDVTATDSYGNTTTLPGAFTYFQAIPAPTITAVTPGAGPAAGGNTVTLTGTGFQAGALVTVNGVSGDRVSVTSSTSLSFTAPPGAPGNATVVVTNPDTQSATYVNGYGYIAAPVVASVLPGSGPASGGTAVVIAGTGFMEGATVLFGAAQGAVTSVAPSVIEVTSPPGAGTVAVTVANWDLQSSTVAGAFTYWAPPVIDAVNPTSGSTAGGTVVTVTGSGFQAGAQLSVGSGTADITSLNSTTIVATTRPGAAGVVDVAVLNTDGQIATMANAFTYVPPPTLLAISPTSGSTLGNTVVTLLGADFRSDATISFGGARAPYVGFVDPTTLIAHTPMHASGPADVVVTQAGQASTLPGAFTFIPPPQILNVSPALGPTAGDAVVTLTGLGFQQGATVTFGGAAATVTDVTPGAITVRTSPHAATPVPVDVIVSNPDGQTGGLAQSYTFVPPPMLGSISPVVGPEPGGTPVSLVGTGFFRGLRVEFGKNLATSVQIRDGEHATAVTPPGTGTVDVVVTNLIGQSSRLQSAFTYQPPPKVVEIFPPSGPSIGGTRITVAGRNFQPGATLNLGGAAATDVVVNSPSQLQATTTARKPGLVNVTVTNPDHQSGALASAFTYVKSPPPVVTSLIPASGSTLGGTAVVVTGTGFSPLATVKFGGIIVQLTSASATSLGFTSPAHAAGLVSLTVTNPDLQSTTVANAFQYIRPPVVSGLSPTQGAALGGTAVVISGAGFQLGVVVEFGGVRATVTKVSSGSIRVTTPAHAPGRVDVRVTNPDRQTDTARGAYTYVP